MNKKLRNSILLVLISAALTSLGWYAKMMFAEGQRQEQVEYAQNKRLYDDHHSSFSDVENRLRILLSKYGKNYALTTYETQDALNLFLDAKDAYVAFAGELDRYGNDEQIYAVSLVQQTIYGICSELGMLQKNAQRVQKEFIATFQAESNSTESSWHVRIIESEMDLLIRNENRAYYTLKEYYWPLLNDLEQYVNYAFRRSLNIRQTKSILEAIDRLQGRNGTTFEYQVKDTPYLVAKNRAMTSPYMIFNASLGNRIDAAAKSNVLSKFAYQVLDKNKYLQK
jgi:hypothetical protein